MDTELSSLLKDIFLGVSAIIVALVGIIGLTTWKSQLKGKARFDVARTIMRLAFKLREDFKSARSLISWAIEFADRVKIRDESEGESQVLNEWHVKRQRLRPLGKHLHELQEAGWEAEAIFDADASVKVSESIAGFRQSYGRLASAIDSLFRHQLNTTVTRLTHETPKNYVEDLMGMVYSGSDDDPFSKRIDEHVESLASTLKRYVR